jgi:DNA-binding TFAR19-related protein (PDSD5 family)
MLQKLAEQQAKRRAEAVELVMQGLEQRLQNFLMSLAETGKDVTSLY